VEFAALLVETHPEPALLWDERSFGPEHPLRRENVVALPVGYSRRHGISLTCDPDRKNIHAAPTPPH